VQKARSDGSNDDNDKPDVGCSFSTLSMQEYVSKITEFHGEIFKFCRRKKRP
jgi:hypothetical protein